MADSAWTRNFRYGSGGLARHRRYPDLVQCTPGERSDGRGGAVQRCVLALSTLQGRSGLLRCIQLQAIDNQCQVVGQHAFGVAGHFGDQVAGAAGDFVGGRNVGQIGHLD